MSFRLHHCLFTVAMLASCHGAFLGPRSFRTWRHRSSYDISALAFVAVAPRLTTASARTQQACPRQLMMSSMDLKHRLTPASPDVFEPETIQYVRASTVPCSLGDSNLGWALDGHTAGVHSCKKLSWGARGQLTVIARLEPDFTFPAGRYSCDIELFVLSGILRIGDRLLRKHGHAFIPAGQWVGEMSVLPTDDPEGLVGEMAHAGVEVLWMQQGGQDSTSLFRKGERDPTVEDDPAYIPAVDSTLVPWGSTESTQFETGKKKMLRRTPDGGGVWLLNIFPHYDGMQPMVQNYNEEAICLSGSVKIGMYQYFPGDYSMTPVGTLAPRHVTEGGSLFFIRIDRPFQLGSVASMRGHPAISACTEVVAVNGVGADEVDWAGDAAPKLAPCLWVPPMFIDQIGRWEGTLTEVSEDGSVERWACTTEIGIHGKYYSERCTVAPAGGGGGAAVRIRCGEFDRSGFLRVGELGAGGESKGGWGKVVSHPEERAGGTLLLERAEGGGGRVLEFVTRGEGKDGRVRAVQHQSEAGGLLKTGQGAERRVASDNACWVPLRSAADAARPMAPRREPRAAA